MGLFWTKIFELYTQTHFIKLIQVRMMLFQFVELSHVSQVIPIDTYGIAIHSSQGLYVMIGLCMNYFIGYDS